MRMDAQTVRWLVFLALIKNFSTYTPNAPFELTPSELEAKEGSCTEIKCAVTRNVADVGSYWFWMKDAKWDETTRDFAATVIYSTNNSMRSVSPDFVGRVTYIGSSSADWNRASKQTVPCSILICDLKKNDSGQYSFRFVGKTKELVWATKKNVTLKVQDNPCLLTFEKPAAVIDPNTITLTCSTLRSCPSNPQIQDLTEVPPTLPQTPQQQNDKKSVTASFGVTWNDDGKVFSCQTTDNTDPYFIRNISVTFEYSPKDVLAKSPGVVKEGDSVSLTCSAKGNPHPNISWFQGEGIQFTGAEWSITSIKDSQSGEYYCKAQNKHGTLASNPVIINVTYAPHVEIKLIRPTSPVREWDEMNLTCNVMRSNPQPDTYAWYKNERVVDGQWQKYYAVQEVTPEHSGVYTCTATNSAGTGKSESLQIEVQYKPRKARISTNGSLDNKVKADEPLKFFCNTSANPAPTIYSWYRYRENKQIDSLLWKSKTSHENSLILERVQRADEACYMCNATNSIDIGENSDFVCIQVLYPPTKPTLSMPAEVTEGQTITITCTVESFPTSTFTLFRTSTSNSRPSVFTQTNNNFDPINTLRHTFNVTSADAGLYSCDAENSQGSKRSLGRTLVVKYIPKVTVQASPGLVVTENSSLTLKCVAQSHPSVTSSTWMKMTDGKDETIQKTQRLTIFTIKSVSPSDSGPYRCAASNDIGTGQSEPVEVKVKYAPKHTNIIIAAEKEERNGRRSVMLSCISHSYPPVSQYSWYQRMKDKHGGKLVFQSQNYTVYSDQPGVYYCIAKNEISEKSSDSVDLFNRDLINALKLFFLCLIILLIIFAIVLAYRCKRKKSIHRTTTNTQPMFGFESWWNGTTRRNLMNETILAEPSRSRDDLLPEQPCHPKAQRRQSHPDSTPASNISTVYCTVALAPGQAPTAQKPARPQGGHTQEDSLNYASLHFWNQPKNKHVKTEEDAVYAKVSKPLKTNEMQEYENVRITHASKPPNPLDDDTDTDSDTSEDEVALNYSQVTFTAKPGHQRADTDSSTSDDDEIQYSAVKV